MPATEVHIVAGPSAAACLQDGLALSPHHVLVHHDFLSCGPLRPVDSLDDWRDVRESYLRSLEIDGPPFSFADQDRDLLTNRERLRSAETITLWLGTGLAEQLMLVWVIALLRRLGADPGGWQARTAIPGFHMLLTIRTTHKPATDLGFLLHKHPDHVHTREFPGDHLDVRNVPNDLKQGNGMAADVGAS